MKKPFFANFLENQVNEEEIQEVKGGLITTSKNEFVNLETMTLKYPSDCDEGGIN